MIQPAVEAGGILVAHSASCGYARQENKQARFSGRYKLFAAFYVAPAGGWGQ